LQVTNTQSRLQEVRDKRLATRPVASTSRAPGPPAYSRNADFDFPNAPAAGPSGAHAPGTSAPSINTPWPRDVMPLASQPALMPMNQPPASTSYPHSAQVRPGSVPPYYATPMPSGPSIPPRRVGRAIPLVPTPTSVTPPHLPFGPQQTAPPQGAVRRVRRRAPPRKPWQG
jgi:hypothetical protein